MGTPIGSAKRFRESEGKGERDPSKKAKRHGMRTEEGGKKCHTSHTLALAVAVALSVEFSGVLKIGGAVFGRAQLGALRPRARGAREAVGVGVGDTALGRALLLGAFCVRKMKGWRCLCGMAS